MARCVARRSRSTSAASGCSATDAAPSTCSSTRRVRRANHFAIPTGDTSAQSMSSSMGPANSMVARSASAPAVKDAAGADALRATMLFAGPIEDDIDWADVSPVGMAKWFARLTRLVDEHVEGRPSVAEQPDAADVDRLRWATHRAIAGSCEDYDAFKYNTVLAKLMGLANETSASVRERGVRGSSVQQSLEAIMLLLAPIAPHIAEELWHRLGHDDSVHLQRFPAHDPALLVEDVVEIPVQVDGKVRDTVQVPSGAGSCAGKRCRWTESS